MTIIEKTIDIERPIRQVYDQWTHFESFPRFMEGVDEVRRTDETKLHWKAEILGVHREWDAEVTELVEDSRVAWRSTDGTTNHGTATFAPTESGTRLTLRMEFEPEGILESIGDALHLVDRRVQGDLERFRDYLDGEDARPGAKVDDAPSSTGFGSEGVRTHGLREDGLGGMPPR